MLPIGPIARSGITSVCINLLRRRVGCDRCAPCGVPDCRGVTLRRERETPKAAIIRRASSPEGSRTVNRWLLG